MRRITQSTVVSGLRHVHMYSKNRPGLCFSLWSGAYLLVEICTYHRGVYTSEPTGLNTKHPKLGLAPLSAVLHARLHLSAFDSRVLQQVDLTGLHCPHWTIGVPLRNGF